jgi:hypothetical protein
VPFAFTGKIGKITLTIDRPQLTADIQKLRDAAAKASDGPAAGEIEGVSPVGGMARIEAKLDKIQDCRKQAEARNLDIFDRIRFVDECAH